MCPRCEGAGRVDDIDLDELVDWDKSLNEGPIKLADYAVGKWYWEIFAESGFFDLDKKLRDYSRRREGPVLPRRDDEGQDRGR